MPAPFARVLAPLTRRAEKRLPSLTRLRAPEALPIRLDRRRIFILPTGFGLLFALLLMVMLLGALNYDNNAALLLTCLLAATCITSMLQTFRALDRLELRTLHAGHAVAGDPVTVELVLHAGPMAHEGLELRMGEQLRTARLAPHADAHVRIPVPTRQRGWMPLPRLRIASTWPFGWFRAWSWLAPAQRVLVYPRPEADGPAPEGAQASMGHSRRAEGDEWSSLRDYRSGDPLRRIAWKASARSQTLRVKTFDRPRDSTVWRLAWQHVRLADREARIARLARWVNEAHAAGGAWALELPGLSLDMDSGETHYHHCMRALAEIQ